MPPILESTRRVVDACGDRVWIPHAGVDAAARFLIPLLRDSAAAPNTWSTSNPLHPQSADRAAIDWIFVIDLLNFSFWTDADDVGTEREYSVTYGGKRWTGYWTLCACLRRALDAGIPATTPSYYAQMSVEAARSLFRGDNDTASMPMLEERVECLRQAGRILCDPTRPYEGTFATCVEMAKCSATRLLEMVLADFPMFRDESQYNGHPVYFCKRAQILVADLWACFDGKDICAFDDIGTITMFADYRVPQALVALGALKYSDDLMAFLGTKHLMEDGDPRECEIRACSIWAVELIRRRITVIGADNGHGVANAIQLDFALWDYAKANWRLLADIPVHHTRSIRY